MSDAITPGHIADNIAFFARALRAAGIPVGPRTVLDAVEAVQAGGIGGREDLYWVLHSVFVTKRDQSILFDQAFRLFWRRRSLIEKMIQMMTPFSPLQKESNEPKPLRALPRRCTATSASSSRWRSRASSSTSVWRCPTRRFSAPRISSG